MRFLPAILLTLASSAGAATLAYVDETGEVVYDAGKGSKTAATEGYELSLSPDGKRLLYTRNETGPNRTLALWDAETGRSRDLVTGLVREARWSPDGARIAFLKDVSDKWQVWMMPAADPAKAVMVAPQEMWTLVGWTSDSKQIVAVSSENVQWLGLTGKTERSVSLNDIYGMQFQNSSSDHLRLHPRNPNLLVVSADYEEALNSAARDGAGLTSGIFLVDLQTRKRTVILSTKIYGMDVEWSGDGTWLYFTRVDSPKRLTVWRMHADGTALEAVAGGSGAAVQ